jgi:hypothetical protein
MAGDHTLLLAAALLLCCVSASAATAVVVELYLRGLPADPVYPPEPKHAEVKNEVKREAATAVDLQQENASANATDASKAPDEPKLALEPSGESTKPAMLDLRSLRGEEVPPALRLDAYVSDDHRLAFDHARVFDDCASVLAALDRLRPYLAQFFRDGEWMQGSSEIAHLTTIHRSTAHDDSDSDDEDEALAGRLSSSSQPRRVSYARSRRQYRSPAWVDPLETAEIVIYPDVDPETFLPAMVVNLEPSDKDAAPRRRVSRASSRSSGSHGWSRSFESSGDGDEQPKQRVIFCDGAVVLGGTFDVSDGSILIDRNVRIEPNVFIKGPAIIGAGTTLRSGAYIRGDVIVGKRVVLRGEVKNAIILDEAELCHPGYCGDSICGFKSHFGNQVTTANLSLLSDMSDSTLCIECDGAIYNTGRKKMGVVLGDESQLGCSSVTDPCTLIQRNTVAYPLARLPKGIYGPDAIIKNKPMQKGVLEIAALRPREDSTHSDVV